MSATFEDRLNQILPRITSPDFLANKGLGNEIGFWIFDYPPEREMEMRAFTTEVIEPALTKIAPPIRHLTINLFETIIELLEKRGLLQKVLKMQADSGNDAVLAPLNSILKEDKVARYMADRYPLKGLDLLMLTGVGASFPMLRSSTLLTALHPIMQDTPLLMFYPGRYNGFSLHLFGKLSASEPDPYYRAFQLVE